MSVWLYGFMTGVRSCRKLEAACRDQIPYLWLTGWQQPDHNTLWRFYKGYRNAMRKLFERTARTAVTMKLVELAVQAVDGTKVGANAAKDRTLNAEELGRLLGRVEKAIADLEAQNEGGEDASAVNLPEELADKRTLREQVRHALDELGSLQDRKRINLTDKDARLMRARPSIFVLGYNAQVMVSPMETDGAVTGMLLTAADVLDQTHDNDQLIPMMEQAEEATGMKAPMTLADAGYFAAAQLEECDRREQQVAVPEPRQQFPFGDPYHKDQFTYDEATDSYTCPQEQTLYFVQRQFIHRTWYRVYRASPTICRSCPAFGVCTKARNGRNIIIGPHDTTLRRHRVWMSTDCQ